MSSQFINHDCCCKDPGQAAQILRCLHLPHHLEGLLRLIADRRFCGLYPSHRSSAGIMGSERVELVRQEDARSPGRTEDGSGLLQDWTLQLIQGKSLEEVSGEIRMPGKHSL